MDLVNPIVDVFSRLWDCIARRTSYIRKLPKNLDSLRAATDRLKHLKNDVKTKLDLAQVQQMRPKEEVQFWIKSVEAMEGQVNEIVEEGTQQISNTCLGGYYPKNCWSSYKISKRATEELTVVEELRSTGNFSDVADILPPANVEKMPCGSTVGMDLIFKNVWECCNLGRCVQRIQRDEGSERNRKEDGVVISRRCKRGIPFPNGKNKSKVIFTTRSEAVCGRVEAHKKIRVQCLRWNEAWNLFQKMVGAETLNSHPNILKLAKIVARKCACLPLSIVTIGRAMASKKTPEEWNHAITVLKKSASESLGMEDKVLPLLKFSYDSLSNDIIRSCFLYCSLYPEDISIYKSTLIGHWIGEGFIAEYDDMNEAFNQGHYIIGMLKSMCLLESGHDEEFYVKMHDVIRDLALWIGCECGMKKDKFLVKARLRLIEAPQVEKWEVAERISLMHNDIRTLLETPKCPNLITLLLNNNRELKRLSNDFFKSMTSLRVLNLSRSSIEEFPNEIAGLVELQYLNLAFTPVKTLPDELEILVKLKYLNLKCTTKLTMFPLKVISRLPMLQWLNLYGSRFGDLELEDCGGAGLGEFENLKRLKVFGITIRTVYALQRLFNSQKLSRCTNYLFIEECQGLISFPLLSSSSSSSTTIGDLNCLKKLSFKSCLDLEELTVSLVVVGEGDNDFFSSLRALYLIHLPTLKMVRVVAHHLCFQNLYHVKIDDCDALEDLSWLVDIQSLQYLDLFRCKGIEEVICGGVVEVEEDSTTFSRLRHINLRNLPKLKSICRHALPFSSLEVIRVYECPELKKLPLDSNSAKNTLKKIIGEKEWWDKLEWEDESIKSVFQPYSKPIDK
ncbi:hypothetical protein HHK36_022637 [Tetracentron sinense]|uniref:NB-ARC domain-containing protein n=1 Tax=Tetracentron sinense TaxID=13715 RepID=A0A834YSC1_TETSI|nr:hypothetical protein HHK36_022637 [Tetracentron sinense]